MRIAAAAMVLVAAASASADNQCHVVTVDFTPTDNLQIVAWVEKADGTFVDTIYMTQKTGLYGLGNRPGRFDFNSGPVVHDLWPYGRRINVFPVWAHRHGLTFPEVVFQDGNENQLSHDFALSSTETDPPYCRPMKLDDATWDVGTCATTNTVYTDKGVFSPTNATSLYPPRADLTRQHEDSPSVDLYKMNNPFDAITHATPLGGMPTEIAWPIPPSFATGEYVLFVEVSKAFDFNDTYNPTSYPPPVVAWSEYGQPYRGQPSIVYSVPFTVGTTESASATQSYAGYGDVNGADGVLHAPDATITTDTPASGASRLSPIAGSTGDVVQVHARPEIDNTPPAEPSQSNPVQVSSSSAVVQFVAPGNDGMIGKVAGYEIRYRANDTMTPDNFDQSTLAGASVVPSPAGSPQSFELDGLLPQTDYWVGVRAYDDCRNYSEIAIVQFTTADRQAGEVNACFIATAAYGSIMANDVEPLRRFRDVILRGTVLGELAIETYYTFSPPVAGVVGESELLRQTARAALAPVVATVKSLSF